MVAPRVFDWKDLSTVIGSGSKVVFFLDYDGTLVPIRKNPDACVLSIRTRELLKRLSVSGKCYPVIISGRSLSNVRKMAGVRGICYVGNHGFDIAGTGIRYTHAAAAKARPALLEVKRLLKRKIRNITGAFIEDKKFSISLHYRTVDEKAIPSVFKCFDEVAAPFINKKKLAFIKGKMVLEMVPYASWNKGYAVLWLLEYLGSDFFPIYAGDDTTDETAFNALKKIGITIKVGKSNKTSASYRIEKQVDLIKMLEKIQNNLRVLTSTGASKYRKCSQDNEKSLCKTFKNFRAQISGIGTSFFS